MTPDEGRERTRPATSTRQLKTHRTHGRISFNYAGRGSKTDRLRFEARKAGLDPDAFHRLPLAASALEDGTAERSKKFGNE